MLQACRRFAARQRVFMLRNLMPHADAVHAAAKVFSYASICRSHRSLNNIDNRQRDVLEIAHENTARRYAQPQNVRRHLRHNGGNAKSSFKQRQL